VVEKAHPIKIAHVLFAANELKSQAFCHCDYLIPQAEQPYDNIDQRLTICWNDNRHTRKWAAQRIAASL
jgi:hypothetical protein